MRLDWALRKKYVLFINLIWVNYEYRLSTQSELFLKGRLSTQSIIRINLDLVFILHFVDPLLTGLGPAKIFFLVFENYFVFLSTWSGSIMNTELVINLYKDRLRTESIIKINLDQVLDLVQGSPEKGFPWHRARFIDDVLFIEQVWW